MTMVVARQASRIDFLIHQETKKNEAQGATFSVGNREEFQEEPVRSDHQLEPMPWNSCSEGKVQSRQFSTARLQLELSVDVAPNSANGDLEGRYLSARLAGSIVVASWGILMLLSHKWTW